MYQGSYSIMPLRYMHYYVIGCKIIGEIKASADPSQWQVIVVFKPQLRESCALCCKYAANLTHFNSVPDPCSFQHLWRVH